MAISERMGFIGGSDIAAILGVSPWTTPYALWEEKVYGIVEEIDAQRAGIFAWGKRLEPIIIDATQEERGLVVTGRNQIYYDREYPWMRCEVDFEFEDDFDGLEIANGDAKTGNVFSKDGWGESGSDEVPTYYVAQFQWGMMITGRKKCLCSVLFGANELRYYLIERNEEIIAHLREAAVQFWDNHVLPKVPPPLKDATDADKMLNKYDGVTLTATDAMRATIRRLAGAKQAIKRLEAVKEAASDEVKIALGTGLNYGGVQTPGKTAIVDAFGKLLVTWDAQEATRVSVERLKAERPMVAKEFSEKTTFRVMRVKDKNL